MAIAARYISANLTPPAANGLRSMTAAMTIATGRRVTTSDMLNALIELGICHEPELIDALKASPAKDGE